MILITGSAGKTGLAILRGLSRRGEKARAMVRKESQRGVALAAGATEVVIGDFLNPTDLIAVMKGIRCIYHICPNMHPDEIEIARRSLQAARTTGVELFVYHSVLHPQTEDMPHHWKKMRVEEMIFQSALPFTILQPCAYMQNILGYWAAILRDGYYEVPYAPETKISIVDLEDVAEAAVRILTEAGHSSAVYELAGPEALSQHEMGRQIAKILGRPVISRLMDRRIWEERVRALGLASYEIETLLKMFQYYEKYGFCGNSRALQCLLGRNPRSFSEYVRQLAFGGSLNG